MMSINRSELLKIIFKKFNSIKSIKPNQIIFYFFSQKNKEIITPFKR